MHYIEKLIKEGEHQQQDFKFRVDDARKIAKTLVAFANTDGGRLLIGVKDNGRIAGVRSDEEYHVIESASQLYTVPEVGFTATIHDVNGKQVLEIEVEPSSDRPHYAIDEEKIQWAYFRKDDENHPANGVIIECWKMQAEGSKSSVLAQYSDVHRKLYDLIHSGERVTISKFIKRANISPSEARKILATFLRWELIDFDIDQHGIFYTDIAESETL
ncbi:MAG: ATP-binding protein [Flavobacteriia bacterium]|nr:ATP-binding protein [Flavobacteriia bacterium]